MLRIENLKLSPGGGPSALRNAVLHAGKPAEHGY